MCDVCYDFPVNSALVGGGKHVLGLARQSQCFPAKKTKHARIEWNKPFLNKPWNEYCGQGSDRFDILNPVEFLIRA